MLAVTCFVSNDRTLTGVPSFDRLAFEGMWSDVSYSTSRSLSVYVNIVPRDGVGEIPEILGKLCSFGSIAEFL